MSDIELGWKVKDTVTGLKGMVTGKAVYLNGCIQCLIEPAVREGQEYREIWIDEDRLEQFPKPKSRGSIATRQKKAAKKKPGGPSSSPPSRSSGRGQ
jgi:hypothetical protein